MDINYWFAFAGQGIQRPGLLKTEYETKKEVRDFINFADKILGYKLSEIMFEAEQETINRTIYTQPITFLYTTYLAKQVSKQINLTGAFGHSLGGITAATFCGFLSFEEGLRIIKKRATLMEEVCKKTNSEGPHMVAIIFDEKKTNLDIKEKFKYSSKPDLEERVKKLVQILKRHKTGDVEISAFNSPTQYVISGNSEILRFPVEIYKNRKEIKRIKKENDEKPKGKLKEILLNLIGSKLSEDTRLMLENDYELFHELKNLLLDEESYLSHVVPLKVGGPFHSQYMFEMAKEFREELLQRNFQKPNPNLIYISDFNGEIIRDEKLLREYLVNALFNPVRWDLTIEKARQINPFFISDPIYTRIIQKYGCVKCLDTKKDLDIK